ncbi:hypothetical protein HPB52_025021 [Rhipicephalus sanguineus]|uniref:Myb/SANT-like DNA-binding domain-containing protein n=1 Tax=Rhipicephalus sanguineus TaxID=34632 RepID=A0A9D4PAX5_RHISA|nr:hypothetical protein HPB52_025021 [Rhipicephalus sanguineus]
MRLYLGSGGAQIRSDDSSEEQPMTPLPGEPPEMSEGELWPRSKVLRFIDEYKDYKSDPRNRLKSNRQMFDDIANVLNRNFPGRALTGSQAENKWRTLKRSYLGTRRKNNTSGHGRVTCEYESELGEILEKSHVSNPPLLLGPGRVRRRNE